MKQSPQDLFMHNCRWWSAFNSRPGRVGFALLLILASSPAPAVVNTEVTRIIFNAEENAQSLTLANSEQGPTLVQVWADEGDPHVTPDEVQTPVVILPPLFKMQPGEIRSLRLLLSSRQSLARDRETLYWLNIYQLPPQTAEDQKNQQKVILPLRIRMKLLIRPQGVAPLAEKEGEKLTFMLQRQDSTRLVIQNPTPWHLTLTGLSCGDYRAQTTMVPPKSSITIPLQGTGAQCKKVSYSVINDSGYRWQYESAL